MNILILGGMGFVGRNLCYHLSKKHTVTVLDNMCGALQAPRFAEVYPEPENFIKASVFDPVPMRAAVEAADVIINCAGQTSHPLSMSDPQLDIRLNVNGPLTVLEMVRGYNPKALVIYISSSTVVGMCLDYWTERTQENPIDIYSANKLTAEKYHEIYRRSYNMNIFVLRLPNLYGSHGKNSPAFGFINYFIGQALEGNPITIFGDGLQQRHVVYIKDVCSEIERLIDSSKMASNLAGSFISPMTLPAKWPISVRKVALAISEVFGVDVDHIPYPEDRKRLEIGDVKVHVPWPPAKWLLKEGLEDIKELMRATASPQLYRNGH